MAGVMQAQGSQALTPQAIEAKMHLTPQQSQQLQRIVVAGKKVMYSPQTHHLMQQQMAAPGPIAQKLGQSIAGLLGILMKESQNSIPPKLLIPAGMVLVADAADFLNKSGSPVAPADIGSAIEIMMRAILGQAKVDPDKMAQAAQAHGAAAQAAPPGAPVATPAPMGA